MATEYTLALGDYVWAEHPTYGGRRLCVITYLYGRGEHEDMARLKVVRWHATASTCRSFLLPVSTLVEAATTPDQRERLDALNRRPLKQ